MTSLLPLEMRQQAMSEEFSSHLGMLHVELLVLFQSKLEWEAWGLDRSCVWLVVGHLIQLAEHALCKQAAVRRHRAVVWLYPPQTQVLLE